MSRRPAVLLCLVALLVSTIAPATARPAASSRSSVAALEVGVLAQLNSIRTASGLRPLRLSSQLGAAARQHTSEMLAQGYFDHESPSGWLFQDRLQHFYGQGAGRGWSAGENILWASPDIGPKKALALWMASPGHRQNILSPSWREIGISAVHATTSPTTFGGGAVTVITTDFGVRR